MSAALPRDAVHVRADGRLIWRDREAPGEAALLADCEALVEAGLGSWVEAEVAAATVNAEPVDRSRPRLLSAAMELAADVNAFEALARGIETPRSRLCPGVLDAVGEPSIGPDLVLDEELALRVELHRGVAAPAVPATAETVEREPGRFQITVYSARDLASLELPDPAEPIVGPFVRRGMATLVGGITGHGKTSWISWLIRAAVEGSDFLGHECIGGVRVLVLDLEQHLASIQRLIREVGLVDCDRVDYAPIPEGLALDRCSEQLDELERVLAAKPYDLVAIDPFYKMHEADSSDEQQARLIVALLRRWIKSYGVALLTATHCRKLPAGRNAISLDDLFGSSLFTRDPELVLGLQRHGNLTRLHVFKSREPGLDTGQTFDLLFDRATGYRVKPARDPREEEAERVEIMAASVAYIEEHPKSSTNAVQKALPWGRDRIREALEAAVRSGLIPEPLEGSRNAKLWIPQSHADSTSRETLSGEVSEEGSGGQAGDDFTGPPRPVRSTEGSPAGEVGEAGEARGPGSLRPRSRTSETMRVSEGSA